MPRMLMLARLCASCLTVLAARSAAAAVYDVSIDTSGLATSSVTLAFDFIAGGGTQPNSLTISRFSSDATLSAFAGPNTGSVTGSLPGDVTLSTLGGTSFFNEALQDLTLGSTLSFRLSATTNAPTGIIPDAFSFFILNQATGNPLPTDDPTGADSLFTLQLDGSPRGSLSVYGSSPAVPVSVAVPEPRGLALLLAGLLGAGLIGRRLRDRLGCVEGRQEPRES